MSKVSITRSLLDDLAMSISAKSGEAVPMTLVEMKDAVDDIQVGSTTVEALSVTENGTYTAPTNHAYSPVTVNVPTPTPSLQTKTKSYTPSETAQSETVTADSGYDGLSSVKVSVGAISSTYVGSGIIRQTSLNGFEEDGSYWVEGLSGYYPNYVDIEVPSGTAGTPTATKGTVSNHSISVTPSVTNTTGYITGSTKTGTAVTVSASELVSGTLTISSSGTKDVTNYESISVANGSATGPSSLSGSSATITTGTNTITLTKTGVTTTPTVSAGYISSATASTATVALTASVTVNPTPTASGATVTIPAGYYTEATSKAVTTMTLPTSAASSATSGYTKKATISRSTSTQYINIAPGYNSAGGYYEISAVANGSATGPSSLSGSSATVSTGTNTLTLTKTGVTTTPTVTAGYVSSATASTATVTLTASVTTKAAATITPTTTNQTIAAGTYLTGAQTIAGDADLIGGNILSTANIFGVQGTVVVQNYYTGSSAPSSSTGSNGDLYLQS